MAYMYITEPIILKIYRDAANPTALPKPCAQSSMNASDFSEDCLDLVLYVPPTAKKNVAGLPSIVWFHGGSFLSGSASDPALDGSKLAIATNSVSSCPSK